MPAELRINTNKTINIDFDYLSQKFGCGKALLEVPRFSGSLAFNKVMESYGINNLYADKRAAKFLHDEKTIGTFCSNAISGKVPLNTNFKFAFVNIDCLLAIDEKRASSWFLSEPENKLAITNYYRDALPNMLSKKGITLTGATVRITPIGWQNLYDIATGDFVNSQKNLKQIEILATLPGARWREPILGLGVTLLNLADPNTIIKDITAAAK